jgi:LPS sulfotransferase NodH
MEETLKALKKALDDPEEGARQVASFVNLLYKDPRTFPEAEERSPAPADRVQMVTHVISDYLAPFREDERKAALFAEKVYESFEKSYGPLKVEGMAAVAAIAEELGQAEIAQRAKGYTQEPLVAAAKEALKEIRELEAEKRVRVVELGG